MNGDGTVGPADMGALLGSWGNPGVGVWVVVRHRMRGGDVERRYLEVAMAWSAILAAMMFGAVAASAGGAALHDGATTTVPKDAAAGGKGALGFTVKNLKGEDVSLEKYRGKVVLIVNTATACGLTKQLRPLQALHVKYEKEGLAVLGFPSNDFGNQEPLDGEAISTHCETEYGVKFPLFGKVKVRGEEKCELYQFLTSAETNPTFAGELEWNFEKFLLDREGNVVERFKPRVQPDSEEVIKAIERELAKGR